MIISLDVNPTTITKRVHVKKRSRVDSSGQKITTFVADEEYDNGDKIRITDRVKMVKGIFGITIEEILSRDVSPIPLC